jgi:hypothetical protein
MNGENEKRLQWLVDRASIGDLLFCFAACLAGGSITPMALH